VKSNINYGLPQNLPVDSRLSWTAFNPKQMDLDLFRFRLEFDCRWLGNCDYVFWLLLDYRVFLFSWITTMQIGSMCILHVG